MMTNDDTLVRWNDDMSGWAEFSLDVIGGGAEPIYRYALGRYLTDPVAAGRTVSDVTTFVMLNPSTATHEKLDATVSRCVKRAERWGSDAVIVVNLFALRARNPKRLREHVDPVGPHNDATILRIAEASTRVVVAWGVGGTLHGRDLHVLELLAGAGCDLWRIGPPTKDGRPRHPLYLADELQLEAHP